MTITEDPATERTAPFGGCETGDPFSDGSSVSRVNADNVPCGSEVDTSSASRANIPGANADDVPCGNEVDTSSATKANIPGANADNVPCGSKTEAPLAAPISAPQNVPTSSESGAMPRRWTLMHGMARARTAWHEHMRRIAQEEGVPDSYRPIIMYLYRSPGASQKTIAEFLNVTTSAVNQAVKSMTLEGYLRREADPSDGRCMKLYLSERGAEVASRLRRRLNESDDAITAFVGAQREEELLKLLHELTDFIRKELPQC